MESPTPTNSECSTTSPDGLIAAIVVLLVILVILVVTFVIIVLVLIRKKKVSTDTVNTLANDESNDKRHKRSFWKYRRSGSQKGELFSHPVFMSKANTLESSHSSQTDLVPKKETSTEALNKIQKKSDDTTVQKELPISEKEKILDKNSEESSSVVTDIAVVDNPSYTLHKQSEEANKSNTAAKKNENKKILEKINEESKETNIVLDEDIVTNPSYNVRRSSSNATEAYTYVKSEEHSRPKSWAVQSSIRSIDESVGVYVDLDIELERQVNRRSKIPLPTQESFENDYV